MKVLVVQGRGPAGAGSQFLCRRLAEGLIGRGHRVDALADPGDDLAGPSVDGVSTHRVDPPPGADSTHHHTAWLAQRAGGYDVVVFFDFAAPTTFTGLRAAAGRVATVLHPMAGDRDLLYLSQFDTTLRLPTAYAYADPEEEGLIADRLSGSRAGGIVGAGVDVDKAGNGDRFRTRIGIGDRPYLLGTGSDPMRFDQLSRLFSAYKTRNRGSLAMVVLDRTVASAPGVDVVCLGPADDATRRDAVAGAMAVVEPSWPHSGTLATVHAWAQARPVLVDRRRSLVVELGRHSGGAIPYRGFSEFEAAIDLLVEEPLIGHALGAAGRRYAETAYDWDRVVGRYERLLRVTQANR